MKLSTLQKLRTTKGKASLHSRSLVNEKGLPRSQTCLDANLRTKDGRNEKTGDTLLLPSRAPLRFVMSLELTPRLVRDPSAKIEAL